MLLTIKIYLVILIAYLELVLMPLDPFNYLGDYELGPIAVEDDEALDYEIERLLG